MIKRERFVITTMMTMMAAVLILGVAATTAISGVYAQEEEDEEEAEEGETLAETTTSPLEQSDNLLTARINGDIFTTGQTITVSGTVEERDINSRVSIEVIDPNGQTVKSGVATVTADNTFTFSFVAGERERFTTYPPMETSGNYRMTLSFFAPGEPGELDFTQDLTSEVEFVFAYTHVEGQPTTTQQQQGGQGTSTAQQPQQEEGPRRTVNVTALNGIIIQGLEQVQRLSNTLVAANAPASTLGQVQSIQDTFMNLRGNLTGVTPLAQGEGLTSNTTATTATPSQPEPLQSQEEQQPPSPPNPGLIF